MDLPDESFRSLIARVRVGDDQAAATLLRVYESTLMRLIRVETGVGLRDGRVGITVDINRDWWGVL